MKRRALRKDHVLAVAFLTWVALSVAAGAQEPTVIRYTHWTNSESITRIVQEIVADFEELHPHIKVEHAPVAWGGEVSYLERIVTWVAGDVMPDVILISYALLPSLAEQGVLLPVDELVARDAEEVRLDDFVGLAVEASSWNGRLYGLPYELGLWWVNVNQTTFAEAGLADPLALAASGDWTWDTMLDAARRITRRAPDGTADRWGIITMTGDVGVYPWLWAYGGDLLDLERTRARLGDEDSVQSMEMMYRLLYEEGVLAFPSWMGIPQITAPWPEAIVTGSFGMQPWWSSLFSDIYMSENVSWNFDIVPFPLGPHGAVTNPSHVHTVAIYAGTAQVDAAWEFVKYITGDGFATLSEAAPGFGPVRMSQFPDWAVALSRVGVEGMLQFFDDGIARTRLRPRHSQILEIESIMHEHLGPVWNNSVPARTALEQAAERINQVLREYEANRAG